MTLSLVPLTVEAFPARLERSRSEYEADLIRLGDSADEAMGYETTSVKMKKAL